jgi:hypothetical protein
MPFYWERHPDGPFVTLEIATTYLDPENYDLEALQQLARHDDDPEMQVFKNELLQALRDPDPAARGRAIRVRRVQRRQRRGIPAEVMARALRRRARQPGARRCHLITAPPGVKGGSCSAVRIGAGIQLAPNALRILDGLGVLPELAALAVHPRRLVIMHADTGRHLTIVDFGASFERRYGHPYAVLHRGDLLAVLHRACQADSRIRLESNREVTELADDGGVARVCPSDGCQYQCDAVIGADGRGRRSAPWSPATERRGWRAFFFLPAAWMSWRAIGSDGRASTPVTGS